MPEEKVQPKLAVDPKPTPPPVEKLIYSWKAPARMFKKRSKEFWTKTAVVATLFGVILYLSEGVMPVILLMTLYFLFYVLSTVEPENIEYRITDRGLYIHKDRTNFNEMFRFWFTKDEGKESLNIDTLVIPGRLVLPINQNDEGKIRTALQKYLTEETPDFSQSDRITNWVTQKLQ